jgi:hypothetical protein
MENPNGGTNPNPENLVDVEEMEKHKYKFVAKEILVEDITGQ